MITLPRTDRSVVGHWWWTVDRWTLAALATLIGMGLMLILAASPAVADRIGLPDFHFVQRQFIYLLPAILVMLGVSMLSPLWVRRLAVILFLIFLALVALTLVAGAEVKGARRWLYIGPLSLQPSEFLKPTFAIVSAWMFAEQNKDDGFPGYVMAVVLFSVVAGFLLLQPDVGMTLVVAAVWLAQFFLAGMPMLLVIVCGVLGVLAGAAAYVLFPHVASRVDRFMDPAAGENYQIERAMEAFGAGGLFGLGPGEGSVKRVLPDAHTDFIFAVAGEEFGLLLCVVILALFAFIVIRGLLRLMGETNLFVMLAGAGLITQFGLQAAINIGVNLHLLPTKGMTLPFISYGGSSLLALALGIGMFLALTRRRTGYEDHP